MPDEERQSAQSSLSATPPEPAVAWSPVTPSGVAGLARQPARLLLVELIVALLATAVMLGLVASNWFPVIDDAVRRLPEQGRIQGRLLHLPLTAPRTLAENAFLAFGVNVSASGSISATADVRVHFYERYFEVCSLAGCHLFRYPAGWTIEFNRPELEPWWGAWRPFLLGLLGLAVLTGLFGAWSVLAACYCPVAYFLAFYADRELNWRGAWRLASAALMPGAALLTMGLLFYGSGVVNLVQLVAFFSGHVVVGWIYLGISPFWLPRPTAQPVRSKNPFGAVAKRHSRNPFEKATSTASADNAPAPSAGAVEPADPATGPHEEKEPPD